MTAHPTSTIDRTAVAGGTRGHAPGRHDEPGPDRATTTAAPVEESAGGLRGRATGRDRTRRFVVEQILPRAAFVVVLVIVWNAIAARSSTNLMPTTGEVWVATRALFTTGVVWGQLWVTIQRVLVGFAAAFALSVALGVAMGRNRWVDRFFEPAVTLGLTIPGLAWAFLCVIWFGISPTTSAVAVVLTCTPQLTLNIIQGTRAVDPDLVEMARVFRFGRLTVLRRVYLASLLPSLLSGARLALSLGWKVVVLVEVFGLSNGVGYQLDSSFSRYDVPDVFAWTLSFAAVMFVLEYGVMGVIERRLTRWRVTS